MDKKRLTTGEGSSVPTSMWVAAVLIGMSSFMFGYALSSMNSCLVLGDGNSASKCYNGDDNSSPSCPVGSLYDDLDLNTYETSIATSLTVLGAWIGCSMGSHPSEVYGRKFTVLSNNFLYIAGALLAASGFDWGLYVGRFLTGLAVGVTSVVAPVLLSEIASDSTRGTITTLHQLLLTIGILMASLLAYGFVMNVSHGWQYVQAFGAVPAVVMLVCAPMIPESPKWLITHKKDHRAALEVLAWMRSDDADVEAEVDRLMKQSEANGDDEKKTTWAEVFAWKKAVVIGCGIMFVQAITGINSVIFYSTTIFGFAGFSESILATSAVGLVNVLTTVLSSYLVDKMGRKTLILAGTYIMFASLMVLSMVLWVGDGIGAKIQGIIAVLAVLTYVFGFAIGLGAVAWVVMSEIMPTQLRAKGFSLFVSINWGLNLLIGLLTLPAIDGLGGYNSNMDDDEQTKAQKTGVAMLYFIFAMITIAGISFITTMVPETKGKTPEELTGGPIGLLLNDGGKTNGSTKDNRDGPYYFAADSGIGGSASNNNHISSPLISSNDSNEANGSGKSFNL